MRFFIEKNAGIGSGISDEDYKRAGATIVPDAAAVFEKADLVLKVKEPQKSEVPMLRKGQLLFSPICTLLPIRNLLLNSPRPVLPVSLTKPSSFPMVSFRCSSRCLKSLVACLLKSALIILSVRWAVAAFCSAAFPASSPAKLSLSVVAWLVPMPPRLLSASALA